MNATVLRIVTVSLILSGPPLVGQQWRPGIWLDAAWNTRTGGISGDRELFMASVELSRPLPTSGRVLLRYSMAATPVAVVAKPASQRPQTPECDSVCPYSGLWSGWDKRYGAGLMPLGLQLEVRLAHSFAITGAAHGGAFWFGRGVPVDDAGHFAFAARLNAGAEVTIPALGRLRGGYGLLHLSNAGLAALNPGLNATLWSLAWSP